MLFATLVTLLLLYQKIYIYAIHPNIVDSSYILNFKSTSEVVGFMWINLLLSISFCCSVFFQEYAFLLVRSGYHQRYMVKGTVCILVANALA